MYSEPNLYCLFQINVLFFDISFQVVNKRYQETHTGQSWGENDTRTARFMGRETQTNENWVINLIEETPIIKVKTKIVATTGHENPALGHPKVYINLEDGEVHSCPYSGQRYQMVKDH